MMGYPVEFLTGVTLAEISENLSSGIGADTELQPDLTSK
jgi:hypothetical protein